MHACWIFHKRRNILEKQLGLEILIEIFMEYRKVWGRSSAGKTNVVKLPRLHFVHEISTIWHAKFIMPQKDRHIVIALLLISYIFVNASAHLEFIGIVTGAQQVTQAKPTQPVPTKVCWTQSKHIPAVTKIAPNPPAIILSLEFPRLGLYGIILISTFTLICPNPDISSFSSRAPPIKSVVS